MSPTAEGDTRIRRGAVWLINFDPSVGGEIQKTRPAVIVSNDAANQALNRIQVVPISSSIQKLYPAEAYVMVNGRRRKVMADQITTASVKRLMRPYADLSNDDMAAVETAIRIQLGLWGPK